MSWRTNLRNPKNLGAIRSTLRGGGIAKRGTGVALKGGGRAALRFGSGRTNLLEELGRVEGEHSNRNRRDEIARVHSELNRGYKDGGRIGFREGTPKLGGAAKKRKIEQTKAVKRLITSDKAYSPKKLLLKAFKKNKYDEGGTGTAKRITTWDNIKDEAKKLQTKLPGSRVSVEDLKNQTRRRGIGWKSALGGKRRSPYSPPQPQDKRPLIPKTERRAEGGRIGFKKGTDKKWMQKVSASIKKRGTKGKCTPITKKGCTGRAKALAKTFKKIAKRRKG
jgi:hypothetical protein